MNYKGIVAMIISGTLGGGFMLIIVGMAWRDKQLTPTGGEVLISLVSGLLVGLGYYMGSRNE